MGDDVYSHRYTNLLPQLSLYIQLYKRYQLALSVDNKALGLTANAQLLLDLMQHPRDNLQQHWQPCTADACDGAHQQPTHEDAGHQQAKQQHTHTHILIHINIHSVCMLLSPAVCAGCSIDAKAHAQRPFVCQRTTCKWPRAAN